MKQEKFVSTIEAGKILGLDRTQVFRLVKSGKIPATRVGRNFAIKLSDIGISNDAITPQVIDSINKTVKRVFKEYGDVIRKLGEE